MEEESSSEVVEVKRDPDQCNHRITSLYSHQRCNKNAQICQQQCKSEMHDIFRDCPHNRCEVQQFKTLFQNLSESCNKQTQHYIRQINEIQKNAIEAIFKKKIESFKEIQQVKTQMMKKTYPALDDKYPNLYQKFQSQRYDTLKCNQVFWVMSTKLNHHPLKHSLVNSKLEGILKKFQNFKEVSKNITKNPLITNKQKTKQEKIKEKLPIMIQFKPQIRKPDYQEEHNSKLELKINEEIKKLYQERNMLINKNRLLTNEINNKIFYQRQAQNRLKIVKNTVNITLPLTEVELNIQKNVQQLNQNQTNKGIIEKRSQCLEEKELKKIHQPTINQQIINQNVETNEKITIAKINQSAEKPAKEIIKQQESQQGYIMWENKELVNQMRKNGQNIETCLKVENIESLRSFPTVKLNPLKNKISPFFKKVLSKEINEKKPHTFNLFALDLFEKQLKKKLNKSDVITNDINKELKDSQQSKRMM